MKYFLPSINFDFSVELIQIALPKLYRHKPIYNVALYHELGHFFDEHHQIIKYCIIKEPSLEPDYWHLKEYFADIFSASYTGYAIHKFLSCIAPDEIKSDSHPATSDRLKNIEDFLDRRTNKYVDLFKDAIISLNLPELKIRFVKPNITKSFNNIRPYKIKSVEEVHGILDAAWEFLANAQESKSLPWSDINEFEIHRIINDLVEKSIRNKMIREKWAYGTTQ